MKQILLLSGTLKQEKKLDKLLQDQNIWHIRPKGTGAYEFVETQIAKFQYNEDCSTMIIHIGRNQSLARTIKDDYGCIHYGMGTNENSDIVCSPEQLVQYILLENKGV